jgi:hypothetical protein
MGIVVVVVVVEVVVVEVVVVVAGATVVVGAASFLPHEARSDAASTAAMASLDVLISRSPSSRWTGSPIAPVP